MSKDVKADNAAFVAALDPRRAPLPTAEENAARAAARDQEALDRTAPNTQFIIEKLAAHRAAMVAEKNTEE